MVSVDEVNSAHEHNIALLIQEFGQDKETAVRKEYREQRQRLEQKASVQLFIPLLTCNATREALERNMARRQISPASHRSLHQPVS